LTNIGSDVDKQKYLVRLISERFQPFVKVSGPLCAAAGILGIREGSLYLTEQRTWLWLGSKPDIVQTMTDAEVSTAISPVAIVRSLLTSMSSTISAYQEHLERVEVDAKDVLSELGFYLTDSSALVIEAVALQGKRYRPSEAS